MTAREAALWAHVRQSKIHDAAASGKLETIYYRPGHRGPSPSLLVTEEQLTKWLGEGGEV
jgi:hypothetical protein